MNEPKSSGAFSSAHQLFGGDLPAPERLEFDDSPLDLDDTPIEFEPSAPLPPAERLTDDDF